MESKILAIAVNTFRESMRERGLLAVLIYLILLPVVALAGGYVAVGQERKILIDVGLALLTLLGLILGVYWGTGMVRVEIDRRVLNFLLAKPLQRWQLIAGKFLGLALTQLVATGLMALALLAILFLSGSLGLLTEARPGDGPVGWESPLWPVLGLIYLELLIVTALALLFAVVTNQALAMILTILLTLIGRSSPELLWLAESASHPVWRAILRATYYAIPNLASFNHLIDAGYGVAIPLRLFTGQLLYAIFTLLVILALTMILFERREV